MNTNVSNLIITCVIYVLITFANVKCNNNDNVELLKPVFGNANSYWFFKTENANVTVSDISQTQTVPSDHSEVNITVSNANQNRTTPTYHSEGRFLNTTQLAEKNGYKVQEHTITTKDGYILTLFRIYGKGPVVFIMHGLLGSSDDFIVSGKHNALAYLLADEGYDVWLGNARGNKYSRDHEFLDPDSKPFWEFCWHDIGVIDLPTMVDHALLVSKTKKLTYIGHSQGTTVFFVLTSVRPEYNEKFNLMISLGTMAWTWHIRVPIFQALMSTPDTQFELLENLGLYEIFPASPANKFVHSKLCCSSKVALLTCLTALFDIGGYDYDQIDYNNACVKMAHIPSGSSMRQLRHFIQLARSREFAQFDFGREKNLVTYGSPSPPPYDVESITTPIVIFYSDNDFISNYDDMHILVRRLPNVLSVNRIKYSSFNHYDFLWARDAERLLYREILNIIAENVPKGECDNKAEEFKIFVK